MRKLIPFIFLLLFSLFLFSQENAYLKGKISPYTAHFISSWQEIQNDSTEEILKKRFGIKRQAGKQNFAEAFIELERNTDPEILSGHGVITNMYLPGINILTARIPVDSIESIALLPYVKNVELSIPVRPKMLNARPLGNIDFVQSGTELDMPYKGKDVVIGIIDGGFDLNHINFYNHDRTEYRIKRFWNQNDTTGLPPSGNMTGSLYQNPEEIKARRYDFTTQTHGTHVAGIASGADTINGNPYYGIAPEADLVFVSYDLNDNAANNVSISNAVKYIYDYAASENKPVVVNMSLGVHYGPHDGTSTFDMICDELQGEGKLLVGAAGNEGSSRSHISHTFTQTNDSLKTFLNYFNRNSLYGWVDIWGEKDKTYSAQLVMYNKTTGEETEITQPLMASTISSGTYRLSSATHGANGSIGVYTGRNSRNGKPNITIIINLNSITTGYSPGLKLRANDGTVHAWTDASYYYFSGENITGWRNGDNDSSVGEIGGTGKRIISVGAYVSNQSSGQKINDIATFSSIGPTPDGRIKPDISAPGSLLVSSFSDAVINNLSYRSSVVGYNNIDNNRYYYGLMQGTSMAAPYVTGVLATWLQAKNSLTPEEVRYIFQDTAINDEYTGNVSVSGSNTWGYGKIDAWNGIKKCLDLKRIENTSKVWGDIAISIDLSSKNMYLEVTNNEATNIQMTIWNTNGQKIMEKPIPAGIGLSTIDMSNTGCGVYFISFTGENLKSKTQKIILP